LTGNSEKKAWKATVRIPDGEGPDDFVDGLRDENCLRITRATRPAATRDLAALVPNGALTKNR